MNKSLLKNIVYGGVGLGLYFSIYSSEDVWVIFSYIALVVAVYHLLPIIVVIFVNNFASAIVHRLPARNDAESAKDRHVLVMTKVLRYSLLIALFLIAFEANKIDNTIHGKHLLWSSCIIGVFSSMLFLFFFSIINRFIFDVGSSDEGFVVGAFILTFFLSAPVIVSKTNRWFAQEEITCKAYIVKRRSCGTGGTKNRLNLFFIRIDGSEERFVTNKEFCETLIEGGKIELCTRKGFWGYDVVEIFNPIIAQPKPDK